MDKNYMKRLNEVTAKVSSRFKIKAQALSVCKMVELETICWMADEKTTRPSNVESRSEKVSYYQKEEETVS